MEKRRSKRVPKRLKVVFEERRTGAYKHTGLTNDISTTGMFVSTTANVAPGSRVRLEVTNDVQTLAFEGLVARQVIVPPELRTVVRAGFGVRFLTGVELFHELVPNAELPASEPLPAFHAPEPVRPVRAADVNLTCDTRDQLRVAWEQELKRGGAFCWLERPWPLESLVQVELLLAFNGQRLTFEARVVHTLPPRAGPHGALQHGVAFMFSDPPAVAAAVAPWL